VSASAHCVVVVVSEKFTTRPSFRPDPSIYASRDVLWCLIYLSVSMKFTTLACHVRQGPAYTISKIRRMHSLDWAESNFSEARQFVPGLYLSVRIWASSPIRGITLTWNMGI
jgi:hypothetical protein